VDFDGTDVDLGHGSGAITLGVYRHLFKPDDRAAMSRDSIGGPSLLLGAKLMFSGLWSTERGKIEPAEASGGV